MNFVRNFSLMGMSVFVRLIAGTLAVVIAARYLGAARFGEFMYWSSIATVLALVSNFGLTTYVLREIGISSGEAKEVLSEVFCAKLLLSFSVFTLGLALCLVFNHSGRAICILLLAAAIFDTFIEFLNSGFRALNRFDTEAKAAILGAVLHLLSVWVALEISPQAISAAVAYCISKFLTLLIIGGVHKKAHNIRFTGIASGFRRIRDSKAYAVDYCLQNLFGQIDSIVLNHYLGPAAVGIYQAGLRVFLAAAQIASILSNSLIGPVAATLGAYQKFSKSSNNLVAVLLLFGALGFLFFKYVPAAMATQIFGGSFSGLAMLRDSFALLYLIRFASAGVGLILTIGGRQRLRTICTLIHWGVIAFAIIYFEIQELSDWVQILIVGNLVLAALYLFFAIKYRVFRPNVVTCLGMFGVGVLVIIGGL